MIWIKVLLIVILFPSVGLGQNNLLGELKTVRSTYPDKVTKGQVGEILNTVAWNNRQDGWALLGKKDGNNCPMPNTNTPISCDFLLHVPTLRGFDVLIDVEGKATPSWGGPHDLSGSIKNGSRSIVLSVEPGTSPNPTPIPDDPNTEYIKKLEEYIKVLNGEILSRDNGIKFRDNIIKELEQRINELNSKIEELNSRPIPSCRVNPSWVVLFGISCRVE